MNEHSLYPLIVERRGAVCWITLNREAARNALSVALMAALEDELHHARADRDVRALVLMGRGEQAFCAGADLKERRTMDRAQVIAFLDAFGRINTLLETAPFPTFAAINGAALGGGLELALACHFRIAVAGAKLGLPEVSLGIIPGAGGTQRLTRIVGYAQALQLILFAQTFSADEALNRGLVHAVVPDTQALVTETERWSQHFEKSAPIAVRSALLAIREGLSQTVDAGLALEHAAYLQTLDSADRLEALQAFAEKRTPHFRGL